MAMLIPIKDVNPTRRFPAITVILIAANVLVFVAVAKGFSLGQDAAYQYGAVPCDVLGRCPSMSTQLDQVFQGHSPIIALFTSMFMHGDVFHLGFNMLFLWVFGNNVEDRLGRIRFPIFYLVTGFIAAFAHIYMSSTSQVPIVGASGAISGILGAYLVLWPTARVVSIVPLGFFFFTVRPPAWVALGLWFVVQVFSLAGSGIEQGGGGVAFWAHIGGFIAGMVLIIPFGGRRDGAGVIHDDRFDRPDPHESGFDRGPFGGDERY
jgi:membrane associated rhomboid family serine protease